MKLKTKHQNSEGLAKGLLPYVETALPGTTCRPWNRFESQETEWLLSPVREWPLYRPGKFYTDMSRAENPDDSTLVVGMYVEKGLTGDAAKMSGKSETMDATWGWHSVLSDIRSGKIASAIHAMSAECCNTCQIMIMAGYDETTYGRYRISLAADESLAVSADKPVDHLSVLSGVTSWKTFADAMDTIAGDEWLWVNLYINVRLSIASRLDEEEDRAWSDQQVWTHILVPLLPWVTKA